MSRRLGYRPSGFRLKPTWFEDPSRHVAPHGRLPGPGGLVFIRATNLAGVDGGGGYLRPRGTRSVAVIGGSTYAFGVAPRRASGSGR